MNQPVSMDQVFLNRIYAIIEANREYRIKNAMDMLQQYVATVSEIAFKVGFSSPAYLKK